MSKYKKIKIGLLGFFILISIILLGNLSNNGRYVYNDEDNVVFDTRTGDLYFTGSGSKIEIGEDIEREPQPEVIF